MSAAYRIRRCEGNRRAWCLIALRPDGSEIDCYGGYKTAYSLDALLADTRSPRPEPGELIELVPS